MKYLLTRVLFQTCSGEHKRWCQAEWQPQYYSLSLFGQKTQSKWMMSDAVILQTSPFVPQKKVSLERQKVSKCFFEWTIHLTNIYVAFQINACVHTKVLKPKGSSFGSSVLASLILFRLLLVRLVLYLC